MTSAPQSASTAPDDGTKVHAAHSTTLIPARGRGAWVIRHRPARTMLDGVPSRKRLARRRAGRPTHASGSRWRSPEWAPAWWPTQIHCPCSSLSLSFEERRLPARRLVGHYSHYVYDLHRML